MPTTEPTVLPSTPENISGRENCTQPPSKYWYTLSALGHGNGQDGVGIGTQQHEARLSQREQAGKAVEQVHGNRHQRIDRRLFDNR